MSLWQFLAMRDGFLEMHVADDSGDAGVKPPSEDEFYAVLERLG